MGNPFVHVEHNSNDQAKAAEFYGKVFDWKLQSMPMGPMTYTMIDVGGGVGGGMGDAPPNVPNHWLAYVGVDDLDATVAKARAAGAQIMLERQEVPDMGWLAVFVDPTGAALGLWQAKNPPPPPKKAATKRPAKKAAKKPAKKAAKKAAKKPAAKKAAKKPAKKAAKKK